MKTFNRSEGLSTAVVAASDAGRFERKYLFPFTETGMFLASDFPPARVPTCRVERGNEEIEEGRQGKSSDGGLSVKSIEGDD